ncbi:TetR/AcrR family transcriptional regulator [Rhizobium skierniewicense]|uniref:TetR/AcrR family transcriptional regulator n=1 Tax=Rhizobium skierniewicense TaxID=984260 RepID=UPI0015729FA3|nr:TetR/AcrR family transcriptional regulator [Rhizobium skierniewicense]NTF35077.1 TetR/AcrR family transcriptional regulator [Rhizobium skierniewicense]
MIDMRPAPRGGRKRDATRDAVILNAAIDTLGEVGFERMTMDLVALRAGAGKATVYRRWASKEALILDAVAQMKREQVDLGKLPDTGTLRGDMLALFKPSSVEESERKLRALAGLSALLAQNASLSGAASNAIVEPWVEANRALLQAALTRGEIAADAPVETMATIIPSLAAYRSLIERKPFDRDFLVEMLDQVLLPALSVSSGSRRT